MIYLRLIILLIILAVLYSCETNVDASDLLDKEQLIIINGYLSPQDAVLKVQVSRSKSITSTVNSKDLIITSANVKITNENNDEAILIYQESTNSYEASANELVITPGKKYFLEVLVDEDKYYATCTVPLLAIQNIEYDIQIRDDNFIGDRLLKVSIDDIKELPNFYIFGASVLELLDNGSGITTENKEIIDFGFRQFASDINRENSIISAIGSFSVSSGISSNKRLKIQVANTEKILFDTLRATYLNDSNGEDPFIESIILPSNIIGKNGFGVFAGYQLTEKEVSF